MGVLQGLADAISGLAGSIVSGITNALNAVVQAILDGLKDVLSFLFVPSSNFFEGRLESFKATFTDKLPFIAKLFEFAESFLEIIMVVDSEPPKFEVTLYGQTMNIVDFSFYDQYRPFIHGLILAIAYFNFAFKYMKRLAGLIMGR